MGSGGGDVGGRVWINYTLFVMLQMGPPLESRGAVVLCGSFAGGWDASGLVRSLEPWFNRGLRLHSLLWVEPWCLGGAAIKWAQLKDWADQVKGEERSPGVGSTVSVFSGGQWGTQRAIGLQ